jgi:hypothetical protein
MPNQSMVGGVLLVVTHSGDETYGDVKTPGNNVRGRIVRGETCGEVTHGDSSSLYNCDQEKFV